MEYGFDKVERQVESNKKTQKPQRTQRGNVGGGRFGDAGRFLGGNARKGCDIRKLNEFT